MGWSALEAGWVVAERARGMSVETIRTRRSWVRLFAAEHPVTAGTATITSWLSREAWAPATRKSARGALRAFYRWAHQAGHVPTDPTADLPTVRVPRRLPRPSTTEQVEAGLAATRPDAALMVRLAAHLGLRRSEIAQLRREDVTTYGLHVRGKGGKDRMIALTPALRRELETRPAGWIFPGRLSGHIHPSTVQRWIREASGVSPHPHRHRFATRAYAGTRNVFAVQQALGHASAETTQIYVQVAALDLEAVVMAAAA